MDHTQDLQKIAEHIDIGGLGGAGAGQPTRESLEEKRSKDEAVLQQMASASDGTVSNLVEGKYSVQTNHPLPELDTDFAKAYRAKNIKHGDEKQAYALVFKKSVPLRLSIIKALKSKTFSHLTLPLASEIIRISSSKQKFFTAVFERPGGKTLSQLLEEKFEFTEGFISQRLLPQILKLLRELQDSGLAMGHLHPDYVYYADNHYITVAECVSTPSGFSQSPIYETAHRAMCMPIGKGEATIADDYYALGVLITHLLLGHAPHEHLDTHSLITSKLSLGSYNTLAGELTISNSMNDLLIGLLNDKAEDRWGYDMTSSWEKGRQFNLMNPSPPKEGTRAIHFNNRAHFNCRSLAYDLYHNWNDAKKFLHEEHIVRWADGSLGKPGLAAMLRHVKNNAALSASSKSIFDKNDELVAQTIIALDPNGPVRTQGYAFGINSLGIILAYGQMIQNQNLVQLVGNLLTSGIISAWIDLRSPEEKERPEIANIKWMTDKASVYVSMTGSGFGLERCLYELNLGLPCQSPIVAKDYVLSLKDLMESLDHAAESIKEEEPVMDRHIAAFIGKSVGLLSEVRIKGLGRFPEIGKHKDIETLALLAMCQQKIGVKKLKNLSSHLTRLLKHISEEIHSVSIRKDLNKDLDRLSKDGNLPALLRVISNPQYLAKDMVGFRQAKQKYKQLYERKKLLQNPTAINSGGYRYGLQLSVIISYLFVAIEILYLVATNM